MKKAPLFLLILLLAQTGCENIDMDMHDQVSFRTQESPRLLNPPGSVPMKGRKKDYSQIDPVTLEPPFLFSTVAPEDGKRGYDLYCRVCHGETGRSDTPVANKLDLTPFDLTEDATKMMTDGEIFWKIVASDSVMPSYRNELTDKQAWEITAYVRKLQDAQ